MVIRGPPSHTLRYRIRPAVTVLHQEQRVGEDRKTQKHQEKGSQSESKDVREKESRYQ